jgi:RNA polymerase sigma factor (sigma-70 family)
MPLAVWSATSVPPRPHRLGWKLCDRELLHDYAMRRDEAAFATLVRRHGPMVLRVCRRVLSNAADADDVFQATFLVLARKASTTHWDDSIANWLYGVTYHLARKAKDAAARRAAHERHVVLERCGDPLADITGRELLHILDDEMQDLPDKYREPLVLCYLEGLTRDEAAQRLGCPLGTLKSRLERGRDLLGQALIRRGVGLGVALAVAVAGRGEGAVPLVLLQTTLTGVRAGLAGAAPTVAALIEGAATPAFPMKRTVSVALLLSAAVVAAGLAGLAQKDEPTSPTPLIAEAPRVQERASQAVDAHGDPLPLGASIRLGTVRFRVPGEVDVVTLAPDGKSLAVSSNGGLFFMDAATGKRIGRLAAADSIMDRTQPIAYSPDGKLLALSGRTSIEKRNTIVRVCELAGAGRAKDYEAERVVWLGWSPDGEPLVVCLEAEALRLKELVSGKSQRLECPDLLEADRSDAVVCSCVATGKVLSVADRKGLVHVWDWATGRELCTVRPKGDFIRSLALASDAKTLATLTRAAVQVWDTSTGKALHTVATDQKLLVTVAFAPDGKTLATAGWTEVRFWDVATGRELARTQDKYTFGSTVTFSSDGKTAFTAERYGNLVHVWDVGTGKQLPQPAGHRSAPHGTAFSPDGKSVATNGSLDGTILVWDLKKGKAVTHVHRPSRWVRDIAFSADGLALFSTWTDENLWVNDATTGERRHVIKLEDPERPDTTSPPYHCSRPPTARRLSPSVTTTARMTARDKGSRTR